MTTTATTFKVPGTAKRVERAERGIVELRIVSQDGDPSVNVFDVRSHEQRVTEALQTLIVRAAELQEADKVTHYRHTPVNVSSPAIVTEEGTLATVTSVEASLTVKFSAVDEVEAFVLAAAALGAEVADVRWKLTEKTRELLVPGVQRRAVKKATDLAGAYADALGYDGALAVDEVEVLDFGIEVEERYDFDAPLITVRSNIALTLSAVEVSDDEDDNSNGCCDLED